MHFRKGKALLNSVLLLAVASASSLSLCFAQSPIQLKDVTAQTGVDFKHTDGSSGKKYLVETVTCGLALFDYDQDGDDDIYFLNGAPLKGADESKNPKNALYRNDGGFKFKDVSEESGLDDEGYGMGVAIGDYDNDGDPDVYLNNFGRNVLYRNEGNGTFVDVTDKACVANGERFGAGACFFDMDADGDLDLYVASYLDFKYEEHVSSSEKGHHAYSNPRFRPAVPDTLFRNEGDGTFVDVSKESGISEYVGWGMGTVCCDYDNDGDVDVFVANDVSENFLFQNDGKGKFQQVGVESGIGFDTFGDALGTMGVDCADYNNDGLFDFVVTNYQYQLNCLYLNLGDGFFEDATYPSGTESKSYVNVGWGTSFIDFDNDGFRDIFFANGHLQDNIELYDDSSTYGQQNLVLRNKGDGTFTDVTSQAGDGMELKLSSRGSVFGDLDNDGDMDAVILNARTGPSILRNDSPQDNHWLQVHLKGTKTNRDAVGARVTLKVGEEMTLIDEVRSGRGYESHYGTRLHFGLGKFDKVDSLQIRWTDGTVETMKNVKSNQALTLVEGQTSK